MVSKEQKAYNSQICKTCGHRREEHNGVDKWCYHPNCECESFMVVLI